MINFGAVPANSVLPIPFDSFAGSTGASITLTGLAVTDVEIYKGTSMTQRASDAGVVLMDTDGIDLDTITGIHGFSIDLSDNTDAGFYSVGSFFWVVVSSVTVDGQTVNFIAATFRIVAAEAIAGKPKTDVDAWLGTAAATPTVAGVPEVDATHVNGSAVGIVGFDRAIRAIGYGTVTTGATTTSVPTSAFNVSLADSNQLAGRVLIFPGDSPGAGTPLQATVITGSTTGATPTFTVSPALTTAPASGSTFIVQ